MKIKYLLFAIVPLIFISCVSTGGIEDFYKSNFEENELSEECFLGENDEPKVYFSSNLDYDINFLKSNYYQILGYATYNGPSQDIDEHVRNMCKLKGALIGLYNYEYTDTRYGVYSRYSGGVSSYNIRRYDYTVILFVSLPILYIQNQKSGFEVKDLDFNTRQNIQRNTGAIIDVVYNESNAFYANLIRNDVLIEINGQPIFTADDYYLYMKNYSGSSFNLKLIRNGREMEVSY